MKFDIHILAKEIVKSILSKQNIYIDGIDFRNSESELFQHSVFVAEVSIVIGKSLGLSEHSPLC